MMTAQISVGDLVRKANGTSAVKTVTAKDLEFVGEVDLIAFDDGIVALLQPGLHLHKTTCDFCSTQIDSELTTADVEMTYYLRPPEPEIAEQTDYAMIDPKHMTIDLTELITTAIEMATPLQNYCNECKNKPHNYIDTTPGIPNPFSRL